VLVSLTSPFPDYVFSPAYSLRPLPEIEKYIKQYSRLPEMPSSEEVRKDGLALGDVTSILVKKMEELTLHVIELNKKVEKLEKENQELRNR
jgi:hypothetical protein